MITTPEGKLKRSYRKHSSMLQRCYNPNHDAFKYYHAKGIEVCDRWRNKGGYEAFVSDMGEPPDGLTLERKDNNGPYSPENCRWATWREQAANRGKIESKRDPNSLSSKAREAGLPYHVVYQRIKKLCWNEEEALSTPAAPRARKSETCPLMDNHQATKIQTLTE